MPQVRETTNESIGTMRSGRTIKPLTLCGEFMSHHVEFKVLDPESCPACNRLAKLDDPVSFKASNDPDTMCCPKAMCQLNAQQFKKAVVKEVNDHTDWKHWKVILKWDVLKDEIILPAAWAMKHKRCMSI